MIVQRLQKERDNCQEEISKLQRDKDNALSELDLVKERWEKAHNSHQKLTVRTSLSNLLFKLLLIFKRKLLILSM